MTTPITPEMLRVGAEAVGQEVTHEYTSSDGAHIIYVGTRISNEEWNPVANAEQDRILDDYLLAHGWHVESCNAESHLIWRVDPPQEVTRFKFDCPRNEFRTRAVYAVVTRKEND